MAVAVFIIWFIWERLAERILAEPPLKLILIVSDIVALILVVVFTFGPIRIG